MAGITSILVIHDVIRWVIRFRFGLVGGLGLLLM